jgi:hypothetical protein
MTEYDDFHDTCRGRIRELEADKKYQAELLSKAADKVIALETELAKAKRDLHECGKYLADAKMDATGADAQRIETEADNSRLRECLKRLQFAPCEDSCEEHEPTDEDDEHNRSCVGCGRYQCLGCKPDCWIAAELKGE